MAGYLISLDSIESLKMYIKHGIFSTKKIKPIKRKNINWGTAQEGTFADYSTMKEGDNIYFFIKRKIYGIGKLINIDNDCKFLNYPGANKPLLYDYAEIKSNLLWDEGDYSNNQRWICTFKPEPYFFGKPVDMDEALASEPKAFKMIRAFYRLSLVKIDDEENQALKRVIIKKNKDIIDGKNAENTFDIKYDHSHEKIKNKINENEKNYKFEVKNILKACNQKNKLKHEMALEAGLLFQLSTKNPQTKKVFGSWDYLTHQVIASPFKPIIYVDKIDIFGYSTIKGYDDTISDFLIAELKKDTANINDINQVMKYVDWVKNEYCSGDYSMINAFLVAYDFNQETIKKVKDLGERKYTVGHRPTVSKEWSNLKLVKYNFNEENGLINFNIIN